MARILYFAFADYSTVFPDAVLLGKKAEYEKRNNEIQTRAMKEMEEVNKKTEKKQKDITTETLQTAENANKRRKQISCQICHMIFVPMNAIIGMTSLIRHDAGNKPK